MVESMALPTPESPAVPGSGLSGPPEPIAEDEMLRHLMHGPVGDPETCMHCREQIVRMPNGHYRLASGDLAKERIKCAESPERKKRHLPGESPLATGDPS